MEERQTPAQTRKAYIEDGRAYTGFGAWISEWRGPPLKPVHQDLK